MKIPDRYPVLLIASTLAIIGLVIFQITWMRHSRKLAEEIFNQRVSMALCSTVEGFQGGALCSNTSGMPTCLPSPSPSEQQFVLAPDLAGDSAFNADLQRSLDFYQIDLDYQMVLTGTSDTSEKSKDVVQCAVAIPADSSQDASFIQLSFDEKETFLLGKMSAMALATIVILLFVAAVLFFANWSFLKQRRILETNVEYFNNMAHEFRTPLANMALAMNLLNKRTNDPKESEYLSIMKSENARLLGQVERVLHLASAHRNDYDLRNEVINLSSLLNGICTEMDLQIKARNAQVSVDIDPSMTISGDKLHLGNVFRNLIDNALKYTGDNPMIRVNATKHEKGIAIAVQDNGIGIPQEQRQMIFEKFQRASNGKIPVQKGFGLGLAYVKRMVELHKGWITLDSQEDKGSKFEVFLPVYA
jgi:signal transduction histidine kinase